MLRLSSSMLDKLNITAGKEVVLSAGSRKTVITIAEHSAENNCFSADSLMLGQMCLRGVNQPLTFYFDQKKNKLKIGPLVGVLSGIPVMFQKSEVISLYQAIATAARNSGMLFYVFTPDLIDFEKKTVNGFYYRPGTRTNRNWVLQEFPLPDVIYNQVGYISKELLPVYRKLLEEHPQDRSAIKWINPVALYDKMLTYDVLCKEQLVKYFLPEARQLTSVSDLKNLLHKHGAVHLKPSVSSLGWGVYKVSLQNNTDDCFIIESHQYGGEKNAEVIRGNDALAAKLKTLISRQAYLAQQSIDLIRFENRPVDFRAHLFKDALGCWDCLAIKARLGPVDGVVTGLSWGGSRLEGEKLLKKLFSPNETEHIIREIETVTLKLARTLEHQQGVEFGELGFDMGVANNKKVWLIEVNPKPNWNVPPDADAAAAEIIFTEHFLGYCRYLLKMNELSVIVAGNNGF